MTEHVWLSREDYKVLILSSSSIMYNREYLLICLPPRIGEKAGCLIIKMNTLLSA
jgi:hypothetical protein